MGNLTASIIGAMFRKDQRRAHWTGFAVSGWMYLLFTHGPWFSDQIRPRLVTTDLLEWAYPLLVPEIRRPEGYGANFLILQVQTPLLGTGVTTESLSGDRRHVDVWAKMSDGTKSLLAEDAQVMGLSNSGNSVTEVRVHVRRDEAISLNQALGAQASLILENHRPGPFSGLRSDPPVTSRDFQSVGHSLFALLFAWLGGIAGRYFSSTSERTDPAGN